MLESFYEYGKIEAGCDEAGRGCLAGPVFAAAVILPQNYRNEVLNDSKQLSEKKRNDLRKEIEQDAISFAVASIDNCEIDKINILNASILAMQVAVSKLLMVPELLLIDGNRFKPYKDIPYKCIVKGDSKFLSIAAASVLAKTYRDEYMLQLHEQFPAYEWKKNKGYPTKAHRRAIETHGVTEFHRLSYRLLDQDQQLKLF